MRVTQLLNYRQTLTQLRDLRSRESKSLQRIASGRRILKPSENPDDSVNAQRTRSVLSRIEARVSRAKMTESQLASYDVALAGVGDIMSRLHHLSVQLANETYNASDRLNAVEEVNQLQASLRSIANTRADDRYIFSGTAADVPAIGGAGTYQGDSNVQQIDLGNPGAPATRITATVTGDEVFFGAGGGTDIMTATTDLITALQNNDTAAIQTAIGESLDGVHQIAAIRARIGATMNRVEAIGERNIDESLRESEVLSHYIDADIAATASELAQAQFGLQAAMTATARIGEVSLLKLL
jgi:flagellar hook-associated protein 3 FlgL